MGSEGNFTFDSWFVQGSMYKFMNRGRGEVYAGFILAIEVCLEERISVPLNQPKEHFPYIVFALMAFS